MSIADYVILAAITVCVVLAVRYMIKRRGSPCTGCSGDCMNCPSHKKGRE